MEILTNAINALLARKLRSALAVLGIVVRAAAPCSGGSCSKR
jgi:hypothetical protein